MQYYSLVKSLTFQKERGRPNQFRVVEGEESTWVNKRGHNGYIVRYPVEEGPRGGKFFVDSHDTIRYIGNIPNVVKGQDQEDLQYGKVNRKF